MGTQIVQDKYTIKEFDTATIISYHEFSGIAQEKLECDPSPTARLTVIRKWFYTDLFSTFSIYPI